MIKLASGVVAALVALCLGGCGSSSNGGGGGAGDDCVRACEKGKALHCPMENATVDCPMGCQAQALLPLCKAEWAALVACSANAPVSCDADGKVSADGCSSQGLAYFGCVLGNFDAGLGGD